MFDHEGILKSYVLWSEEDADVEILEKNDNQVFTTLF